MAQPETRGEPAGRGEPNGGRRFVPLLKLSSATGAAARHVLVNDDGSEMIETLPAPPTRFRRHGRTARRR